MTDTIFALATAPVRAAIAVMRLSGPAAGAALEALAGRLPAPRRAAVRRLFDPGTGQALDEALVLWMPAPASFTGEDQVELHLHGGRGVIAGASEALAGLGLRSAEPGEFTRRAFENGRLDLAQAEAIADLVDAETEAQRRQALHQLEGALGARQAAWRETILNALAYLETTVDFVEEDVPEGLVERALQPVDALRQELLAAAADRSAERVREGFRVALVGEPNVGKSSLLNALAGREAAIVTAIPGTTRDIIEAPLVVAGAPVLLADTAGDRETDDVVEAEGVRRGRAWAASADLRLLLRDAPWNPASEDAVPLGPETVIVYTKRDLRDVDFAPALLGKSASAVDVSVRTGGGLERLLGLIEQRVAQSVTGSETAPLTRLRHRALVQEAAEHLGRAIADQQLSVELVAENLRLAARALERLTGRIDPEAILGRVFSTFCIGK